MDFDWIYALKIASAAPISFVIVYVISSIKNENKG